MNFSSGDNITFLDLITLISFVIGLENLQENLGQSDKQELQNNLSEKADVILKEIHKHLQEQDDKLEEIRRLLNEKN